MNTYHITTMSPIRIKVSNNFGNISTTKRYWWDNFFCSFQKFRGNFTGVIYQRALISKEGVEFSTFSLKMVTYLLWWIKVEIQGFFNCSKTSSKSTHRLLNWSLDPGVDSEILKRRDALCQPPQLADEENFRFTMV